MGELIVDDGSEITIEDFLILLQQTPRTWYLTEKEEIRCKSVLPQCPIIAVYAQYAQESNNGNPLLPWQYRDAAKALHMLECTAEDIVAAGDATEDEAYDPELRLALLAACGLIEIEV